jgi:regulator of ribosome biosynthesis
MNPRLLPLQIDIPLLATYDINEVEIRPEADGEESLRLTAQEDLQELVNALFSLPQESGVCSLPSLHPTTTSKGSLLQLPRIHPLPSQRPATRWQQFAKLKGIKKRKRSAMMYDEQLGDYVARHGGKSAKNLKKQQEDWCVEVD